MIGIGLALYFKDYFSSNANKARSSMASLYNLSLKAEKKLTSNVIAMRNMSIAGTYAGAKMTQEMGNWVTLGNEFEQQMKNIQANMNATPGQMAQIERGAIDMAREFRTTPILIAEATKEMLKAGATLKNAPKATKAAISLGIIGETDLSGSGGSIDILTAGLSIFNRTLDDSMSLVNKIATTANRTTADVKDLGESFKYGGTEAYRMGISIEHFLAFQGMLAQSGIRGSMAGTVSSNFFRYTADLLGNSPTKKALEAANSIGLSRERLMRTLYQDPNKGGGLLGVLRELGKATKGLDPITKMNVMDNIFGVRGSRMGGLLDQLDKSKFGESFTSLLKAIENASESDTMRQVNTRLETAGKYTDALKGSWQEFAISFQQAVRPMLIPLLKIFIGGLQKLADFGRTRFGKLTFGLLGVAVVLGTVALAINSVVFALAALQLQGLLPFIGGVGTLFKGGQFLPGGGRAPRGGTILGGGLLTQFFDKLKGAGIWISKLVPRLGMFSRVLSGPIGLFITLGGALLGFGNMVKLVGLALGSFFIALAHPWDFLKSITGMEGFFGESTYNNYDNLKRKLSEDLGFDDEERFKNQSSQNAARTNMQNPYLSKRLVEFDSLMKNKSQDKNIVVRITNINEYGLNTIKEYTKKDLDRDIQNLIPATP